MPLLAPALLLRGGRARFEPSQGTIGTEMYFVLTGKVEVIIHGLLVKTLTSGAFVGEGVLIGNGKRAASIRAATACDVLVLSRGAFEKVLASNPLLHRQVRSARAEASCASLAADALRACTGACVRTLALLGNMKRRCRQGMRIFGALGSARLLARRGRHSVTLTARRADAPSAARRSSR